MAIVRKKRIPEVQELLEEFGPSTSTFLAQKLEEAGATKLAARQRLSRVKEPVYRLDRIRFPHRASFFYLGHQRFTENFTDRLRNPVSVHLFAEIRCQFTFSGKNNDLTPDFLSQIARATSPTNNVPVRL